MTNHLLDKRIFVAEDLVKKSTPRFFHPNKELLYELAFSRHQESRGEITYSRWSPRQLPERLTVTDKATDVSCRLGYFDYAPSMESDGAQWYMNFAHYDVFSSWATSLFAQDEMQVAEHPSLIALRLVADAEDMSMMCVQDGSPTPILIAGVERRLSIDTSPHTELPRGLYGNQFKLAWPEQVEAATTVLSPTIRTNIVAIEAPSDGEGYYSAKDILHVLNTAYSGFSAVRDESLATLNSTFVTLNTGFWGCGAYGGNRVLMILLQVIAAELAGINRMVFFLGGLEGKESFDKALEILNELKGGHELDMSELVCSLQKMNFSWGYSDGN